MGNDCHTVIGSSRPGSAMTRTEMLMQDIRRRIISGALPAGERLPSVRRYAAQMQVSPSTVMEAYERLA
ncbi:GntR family transcriptional regulator, partial [Enterobacter hormaechei]|uniref:GntR family transcriptional regulator n=1 Tax=Enterobacter hormaechei TaxID=158836 RepID=UPI003B21E404